MAPSPFRKLQVNLSPTGNTIGVTETVVLKGCAPFFFLSFKMRLLEIFKLFRWIMLCGSLDLLGSAGSHLSLCVPAGAQHVHSSIQAAGSTAAMSACGCVPFAT